MFETVSKVAASCTASVGLRPNLPNNSFTQKSSRVGFSVWRGFPKYGISASRSFLLAVFPYSGLLLQEESNFSVSRRVAIERKMFLKKRQKEFKNLFRKRKSSHSTGDSVSKVEMD
jgi:hypothetical protein